MGERESNREEVSQGRAANLDGALRRSELKYRTIVETSSEGIILLDRKGYITFANKRMAEMTGYAESEQPKLYTDYLASDVDREQALARWKLRQKGISERYEIRLKHKDGTVHWYLNSISPIFTPEGKFDGALAMFTDIDELKRTEESLRENQRKLQTLFDSDLMGISYSGPNGRIFDANDAYLRITGYSREDLVTGRLNWLKLTPPEYEPLDKTSREETVRTGSCSPYEKEYIRKDGRRIHIIRRGVLLDPVGPVFASFVLDATPLKRALDALARERQIREAMMENTGAQLAYLDRDFNFIMVNSTYARGSGYRREELIGNNLFSLFPSDENKAVFEQVRDTGYPVHFHEQPFLVSVQPEGGTTYWDWTLAPVKDESDFVEGLVLSLVETTERVHVREKMRTYERLATLGELSGGIAHELRNPLATIDSSAYYLQRILQQARDQMAADESQKMATHLGRIRSGIARCSAIIESLLNLARLKEPKRMRLDLRTVTAEIVGGVKIPDNVNVIQEFPDHEVAVEGDRDQFRMAFENLISNAVQAMNEQGTLSISISSDSNQALLTFTDTGVGIPAERLDQLFQPLFTTKANGVGFGLAIAKKVIEAHGGTISARSQVGQGTSIIINLPLAG